MAASDSNIVQMNEADRLRFWSKVLCASPDECWLWQAGCFERGYGMFTLKPRTCHAHRVAWILTNGVIPDDLYVCHRCDNRPCCNPAHLFLGTAADNNRDCQEKGRVSRGEQHSATVDPSKRARGERNGFSKLTAEKVIEIRHKVAGGMTQTAVGLEMGISQRTISLIMLGKSWTHVVG